MHTLIGIYFATATPPPTCGASNILPGQRTVTVATLRRIGDVPRGTFTLPITGDTAGENAYADTCFGSKETCRPAIGGSITVNDFDVSAPVVEGWYTVTFPNQDPVATSFRLQHCSLEGGGCF